MKKLVTLPSKIINVEYKGPKKQLKVSETLENIGRCIYMTYMHNLCSFQKEKKKKNDLCMSKMLTLTPKL